MSNLKLEPALLSRFDLVFVLLDKPDSDVDRMLSEQVLGSFSKGDTKIKTLYGDVSPVGNEKPNLTPNQLRRLIAFARTHLHPVLSKEAAEVLQAFYLELRRNNTDDILPITTRHLEAMIRLSQARARMQLRTVVDASDATEIINLMYNNVL